MTTFAQTFAVRTAAQSIADALMVLTIRVRQGQKPTFEEMGYLLKRLGEAQMALEA
jgi:hypothetical protein